jgi:hypothetical protein
MNAYKQTSLNIKDEKMVIPQPSGWPLFLMLLFSVKGILVWIDHRPMFFLGDSASYIWTALSGWLPPDRSFIYGYFIRLVAISTKSLLSLVIVQVLLSSLAAIVLAYLLIRYFRVRSWLAFTVALLCSLEPLQLLYERYVMTETLALVVFVFYIWTVIHYLEDAQFKWLWIIQGVATLLISIRFAFIPMVWICSPVIPILAFPGIANRARSAKTKTLGRMAIHLSMSVFTLFLFTSIYKHINGSMQSKPPAYSYNSGLFALGYTLPIVEPEDFSDKILGYKLFHDLKFSHTDRRARLAQHWLEEGAITQLQKLEPDLIKADAQARQAALHAIIHKPFAFMKLAWNTFTDYFDRSYLQSTMRADVGNRRLDDKFQKLITTHFNYPQNRSSAMDLPTITGRYFLHSGPWFQFLLFLPICWGLLSIGLHEDIQRRKFFFLCLVSVISSGVTLFLVEQPEVRYLHVAAWLFFLMAGVGLNRFFINQK